MQVLWHGAKVDKAIGGGRYVAMIGGGSGRCYVYMYALMVMSWV